MQPVAYCGRVPRLRFTLSSWMQRTSGHKAFMSDTASVRFPRLHADYFCRSRRWQGQGCRADWRRLHRMITDLSGSWRELQVAEIPNPDGPRDIGRPT